MDVGENTGLQGTNWDAPGVWGIFCAYYLIAAAGFLAVRILGRGRRERLRKGTDARGPAEDDLWQMFFVGLNPVFAVLLFPLFWPLVLGLQALLRRIPEESPASNLAENRETSFGRGAREGLAGWEGCEGTAVCDLRPSGRVEVRGEVIEAVSRDGFIHQGQRVRVAGTDGFRLLVVKAE